MFQIVDGHQVSLLFVELFGGREQLLLGLGELIIELLLRNLLFRQLGLEIVDLLLILLDVGLLLFVLGLQGLVDVILRLRSEFKLLCFLLELPLVTRQVVNVILHRLHFLLIEVRLHLQLIDPLLVLNIFNTQFQAFLLVSCGLFLVLCDILLHIIYFKLGLIVLMLEVIVDRMQNVQFHVDAPPKLYFFFVVPVELLHFFMELFIDSNLLIQFFPEIEIVSMLLLEFALCFVLEDLHVFLHRLEPELLRVQVGLVLEVQSSDLRLVIGFGAVLQEDAEDLP